MRFRVGSLLLACLLLWPSLVAGFASPRMKRYSPADGLPSRQVVQLAQDARGFVWAATPDGLARLDGHAIRVWQHAPGQAGSLPGNDVETLAVDSRGGVLMGINGHGLVRLHPDGISVETYEQVNDTCGRQIWTLATHGDDVWIGGNGRGICRLHPDGRIDRIEVGNGVGQLRDGSIMAMRADGAGRMWIATLDGLWRWHDGLLQEVGSAVFGGHPVARLRLDASGVAWVGDRRGLWRIGSNDLPEAVPAMGGQPQPWPDVLHDRRGSLWIGTSRGLFLRENGIDQHLSGDAGSGFLTERSGVLDLLEDHEGGIWFATQGQGLAYLPPSWQRFWTRYEMGGVALDSIELNAATPDGDGFLIASDSMLLQLDGQGQLRPLPGWSAINDGGVLSVLVVDSDEIWLGRTGRITRIGRDGRLKGHLTLARAGARNRVDLMVPAEDGSIWLAVIGAGLEQRTRDGRLLRVLAAGGPEGLPEDFIHQIRPAPDGSLWLATGAGVYRWDGQQVRPVAGIPAGETYDLVFAWHQLVWVASHGTLTRYLWDKDTAVQQERIGAAQGMPPVEIGGLHAGDGGTVWATTSRGLLRWGGQGRVRVFGQHDGLENVEFSDRPPVRNGNRVLALSAMGLTVFSLDAQSDPLPPSRLVIDAVRIRRQGGQSSLSLPPTRTVEVHEGDYDLAIQARILSFANPVAHAYRYRVDGRNTGWRLADASGYIPLSGLPGGRHRILVQAHNGDGNWQSAEAVDVHVLPVWWARPVMLVVWGLLAGAAVLTLVLVLRLRRQRRERWRMHEHGRQVAEQASREKTRFLATLGHEVRTPMTGVLGMSELLLDTPLEDTQRESVAAIHAAGAHLLRLLDDTLDMAALESGQVALLERPFALQGLLQDVAAAVEPRLHERGLVLAPPAGLPGPVWVHGDPQRLRQLIVNLVSHLARNNLFPLIGLQVSLSPLGDAVALVLHNGQLSDAPAWSDVSVGSESPAAGAGLELAIAAVMAGAMGGEVQMASQAGSGRCLRVRLPLRWGMGDGPGNVPTDTLPVAGDGEGPMRVLLVEDDLTVARVVTGLLEGRAHRVRHAANGLQALTMISTETFDVGLLDLDLPGIDGLSLARQIRALGISMPLLAVTARADAGTEEDVRAAGMDACVRKPVTGILLAEAMVRVVRSPPAGVEDIEEHES